jgi:putative hemolysin
VSRRPRSLFCVTHSSTLHSTSSTIAASHDAAQVLALHGAYPRLAANVPPGVHRSGRYSLRFASTPSQLRAVQRLRFRVFNLELSEGLESSYDTGLDEDAFDDGCHHLMVVDDALDEVVGTYRIMTSELAPREHLYSASEFDLSSLPDAWFRHGAEVGRACVAKEHRNGRVLQLLWRGIARYLDWNDKRFVFGCCSVPSLGVGQIAAVSLKLARGEHLHPRHWASALPALRGEASDDAMAQPEPALPPLFTSYLRMGAKVCGGPAFDRGFGVTDFLVVLDLREMEPRLLGQLTAPGLWDTAA